MAGKDGVGLAVRFPQAHVGVVAPRQQETTVRREPDVVGRGLERRHGFAGEVPQAGGVVKGRGREEVALR